MDSINSSKKINLTGAILIIISQVVGIGIFFKNGSVFKNNDNNPYGVLASWLLAAIIIMCIALSIVKVANMHQKNCKYEGISKWMNTVIGHRISRFSANIMNLCFYPILGVVLAFFSVEAIFAIFNGYNQPIYLLVITTIGLTILFVSLNFISEKISMKAGVIAGYIKFLPMIICVIACIVIVIKGNNINFFDNSQTQVSVGSFNVLNVLDSLPATLFAFNGYLVVGEMGHKIKDPQKNTGRAIIIAVLIIAGIYIATSLTLIIVGDANGNVLAILNLIFGDNVGPRIMSCVLLFVALGSTISFLMVSFHTITKQIENKDLVGYDKLKRLNNKRHNLGNLVGTSLVLSVWAIIVFVPTLILKTDQPIDIVSNNISLALLILCGIVCSHQFIIMVKKPNSYKTFDIIIAFFAAFFLIGAIGYYSLWAEIVTPILHPGTESNTGVFFTNPNFIMKLNYEAIIYWTFMIGIAAFPFACDGLIKLTNKKYSEKYIWSK